MLAAISLAPVIGPPEATARQLRADVERAGQANRIAILPDRDPKATYGMRGYIVAARDRGGIKVSYIWDVTDAAGKRVNRITGEETTVPAAGSTDPWAALTPPVTQAIANKVATSLASWLPSQPGAAMPVAAVPSTTASGAGAGSLAARPVNSVTPTPAVATGNSTGATTASLPVASAIPTVTGAPGDGNTALASALHKEFSRQGVDLSRQNGGYRVEGVVAMGAVADGKQAIRIDWRVKDGKGAAVGTVTQKNNIPPGSLDGAWGRTAEAAAAAAVQGIIKLLPKSG
jgi:hypothetical protein